MARPAPPSDDGSPARLIATMVGIVGILLLGSLAWSAVGALVSAVGAASTALSSAVSPPPAATLGPVAAVTPVSGASPASTATLASTVAGAARPATTPTGQPATTPATRTPVPAATPLAAATPLPAATPLAAATPLPAATPTAVAAVRNPWILLPQPEPGAKVPPGSITVEARGRGDAPITAMRLEIDGAALPTAIEQRSDTTWRGSATTRVAQGQHSVRATVTDADGRSGSFRWTFTAAPAP